MTGGPRKLGFHNVLMLSFPPHLDFNLVESLAVVHSDHGPDHLRQDDHVPQMGLHHLRFLHGWRLFLCLAQALQEGLLLAAQATVQPPPLAGAVQLHQLLTTQVKGTETSAKPLVIFEIHGFFVKGRTVERSGNCFLNLVMSCTPQLHATDTRRIVFPMSVPCPVSSARFC